MSAVTVIDVAFHVTTRPVGTTDDQIGALLSGAAPAEGMRDSSVVFALFNALSACDALPALRCRSVCGRVFQRTACRRAPASTLLRWTWACRMRPSPSQMMWLQVQRPRLRRIRGRLAQLARLVVEAHPQLKAAASARLGACSCVYVCVCAAPLCPMHATANSARGWVTPSWRAL
jgi:hypothetical protein